MRNSPASHPATLFSVSRHIPLAAWLLVLFFAPAALEAEILWQHPQPVHVREDSVEILKGALPPRDDESSGTLYLKFRVDPQSDGMIEVQLAARYYAGLVFRKGDRDHFGVGNARDALGYSAFAPSFNYPRNLPGELNLRTAKLELGTNPYQAPRRGALATLVVKIDYVPNGEDLVTVWLDPDLSPGATENKQSEEIATRFKVDASFDQLRLAHSGIGPGWTFDQLAVATAFDDFVPVPFWQRGWVRVLMVLLPVSLLVAIVVGLERRRARRKLAVVEREQAVAAERVRIAQDLHDDLGAKLTEIVLMGELAKGGPADQQSSPLTGILSGLRDLHASLDEAVWSINPRHDSLANLVEFASDSAQRFTQHAAVEFHLDVPGELPPVVLSASQRHNLLLAIKEALHNAVRHAAARTIRLGFRYEVPDLCVTITDNGCGFAIDDAGDSGDGLRNMKARLEAMGGSADIHTVPGEGTAVSFRLPLPAAKS
jgi:signal transduction histidine kinase